MTRHSRDEAGHDAGPWWKRFGWFVALWLASVAVVLAVAYGIRFWIT
ncbi:hypothetical protein jaqu_30460 [Jannaschia aquimarina]|uniref:DUF2474 domain-containing protein n=1 Tax=Jannaschia aquimarina TaxID=935700 RepID=A0A0D1D5H6_9RHOB|nr:hypothetical protein jaqu_30460 [Jannaschia aquimarina]SNT32684.1 Protein of unknown function [Jannaschia aquimarina]